MARYFGYFNLVLTDYLEFRFYGEPIKIGEYDPGLRRAMGAYYTPGTANDCLSREGTLHMIFKLGMCAKKNWQRLLGFEYLGKVITGVKFKNGIKVSTKNRQVA